MTVFVRAVVEKSTVGVSKIFRVMRAAMVYHYATPDSEGWRPFNQDWTEVLRDGQPVQASTEPVPIEY